MRPLRIALWVGALAALAAGGGPARAAWDNVFQVCCHGCNTAPATSGYYAAYPTAPATSGYVAAAAPADGCCPQPQPCPRQVCETRYEQKTYVAYETHYEQRTAYDPVTTYSKSYYWEPVTGYRTSCYYDSCSCSYKQVSVPTTSYRLREQCCPVQSWVARCYSVPVTVAKPYTRCEPVTSCYWTTATPYAGQQPGVPVNPSPGAGVNDNGRPPANGGQPGVNDNGDNGNGSSSGFRGTRKGSDADNPNGSRQYLPQGNPVPKTTPVHPEKFVSVPPRATLGAAVAVLPPNVEGEVVRADRSPDAGVRLTFKRADREGETHTVTADNGGRFKATLAGGGWVVYTQGADGRLAKRTTIDVREDRTSQVRLTSR